jgi:Holliday junction resolvase RusA-like endonuclease
MTDPRALPIEFTVPGKPVPFTRVLKGSRQPRAERYRQYRKDVGWAAKQAGAEVIDGPVCLDLKIIVPDRLKRRWDVDNIIKCYADALEGICYANDRQITSVTARIYTAGYFGREEGVSVCVIPVV